MNINDELKKFCRNRRSIFSQTYEQIMLFMEKHKSEWISPYFVVHLTDIRPEILFRKLKNTGCKSLDINKIDKAMSSFLTKLSRFGLLERRGLGEEVTFRYTGVMSDRSCGKCYKVDSNQEYENCDKCRNKTAQRKKDWITKIKKKALLEKKILCNYCLKVIPSNSGHLHCVKCLAFSAMNKRIRYKSKKKIKPI